MGRKVPSGPPLSERMNGRKEMKRLHVVWRHNFFPSITASSHLSLSRLSVMKIFLLQFDVFSLSKRLFILQPKLREKRKIQHDSREESKIEKFNFQFFFASTLVRFYLFVTVFVLWWRCRGSSFFILSNKIHFLFPPSWEEIESIIARRHVSLGSK